VVNVARTIALLLASLSTVTVRADLWRTGYYPGWEQSAMPPSAIDYVALTHIIHFSAEPNTNGTLNTTDNVLSTGNSSAIVSAAHAAGKKVLVCIGGGGTQAGFQAATGPTNLTTFINNITNLMSGRGYDGVDIDWEPLDPGDANQFTNFVNSLRAKLDTISPRPMLTAAVAVPPTPASLLASVQSQFDQFNLMTYDLSGPWDGWVTWFNSPLYDGGYRFPSTGGLVPSCDGTVNAVTAAGIPLSKLGLGVAFYGYVWTGGAGTTNGGVAAPRQSWTTAPTTAQASYNSLMSTYFQPSRYHWDAAAQAAYLSIDNTGSSTDRFISYDDVRTCQAKVSFARNRGLGGIMIWELAQDHIASQVDPLLAAIKAAMASPGAVTIQPISAQNIEITFNAIPLGSYRVQWTTNLADQIWNSLLVTNIPNTSTGGLVRVQDTLPPSARFYRVRTPP
jgi:chitinase